MIIKFNKNFKQWLLENRWTPSSLANDLGVSRQTIHHWIEGVSLPKNQKVINKLYQYGGDGLIAFESKKDRPLIARKKSFLQVEGGYEIGGNIKISGAKNAALPMICASLLTSEFCTFLDVPHITDIENLIFILTTIGVWVDYSPEKKELKVQAKNIDLDKLKKLEEVKKFRASILIIGPILARFGYCEILKPGGCVLGARSNSIHTRSLEALGAQIEETDTSLKFTFAQKKIKTSRLFFSEASVTGTENLSMFLAGQEESCEINFVAMESHVSATLDMLVAMGAQIEGIGKHIIRIQGKKKLKGGVFRIPPDGLLAGTYAISAILTNGALCIENVNHNELASFYGILKSLGVSFEVVSDTLKIKPDHNLSAVPKIQTGIFPGFSTDLQSPLGVLLTQCEGETLLFETLFENRLTYLSELEKMGAKIQLLNPYQAIIKGKVPLFASEVQSWDLRAGAAMVLAGLTAQGVTKVTNIDYIDRGYEYFVENLISLGAKIERFN